MATLKDGPIHWSMERDAEGYRQYRVVWRVRASPTEGPASVLTAPGLPQPGTIWQIADDVDIWAWCRPDAIVTPVVEGERNRDWTVEQIFSNKPLPRNRQRPTGTPVENPLLEPMKISGGGRTSREEATHDRFGRPLFTSSWEQLRGPQVEFDRSTPTVRVEQNVANLQLALCELMRDTVNALPMWGMRRRCIKLSDFTWERRFYGSGLIYYTRTFEFEVDGRTFDRLIQDEGTRVLSGKWDPESGEWLLVDINGQPPDPRNPAHFIQAVYREGNPARIILDGRGRPWVPENETELEGGFLPAELSVPGATCQDALEIAESVDVVHIPPLLTGNAAMIDPPLPEDSEHWYKWTGTGVRHFTFQVQQIHGEGVRTFELYKGTCPGGLVLVASATKDDTTPAEELDFCLGGSFDSGDTYVRIASFAPVHYTMIPGTGSCPADRRSTPGRIYVERYPESNFFLLGMPLTL